MTEVLQANIFFAIASIATIVFCIMVGMVMFQLFKVIRLIRSILERVESASEVVAEDMANVRQLVKGGGVLSSIFNLAFGAQKKRSKRKKTEDVD